MIFIFMNHHLRRKRSREPVITIQFSDGKRIHANEVRIVGEARVRTGKCREITSHEVRAWLELEHGKVEVVS